jgi:hypothetical protein
MGSSISRWVARLFEERYESRPPWGVTRRCLPGGMSWGGDPSPEGVTGPAQGCEETQAELPGPQHLSSRPVSGSAAAVIPGIGALSAGAGGGKSWHRPAACVPATRRHAQDGG